MGKWIGVVPNAGAALLAGWIDGKVLNFEGADAGTGTVPDVSLLAQTAIVNKQQTANVTGHEKISKGIKLRIQLTKSQVGYTLNQFGVWARLDGGARTLLALFQNVEGVPIPSHADSPDFSYNFYGTVAIDNNGVFTVTIDPSGLVSLELLNEAIATKQDKIHAHGILKGNVDGGVDSAIADIDYQTPLKTAEQKAVPVDGDGFAIVDAKDGGKTKLLLWEVLSASLKQYFDGIYAELEHEHDWDAILKKPEAFIPTLHATSHQKGGLDQLRPGDVGADPEGTAEAVTGAHDKSLVAHTDIRQAAASAQAAADEARAIAEGRSRGASFLSYEAMVGALNAAAKTAHKMGDNFFIQTVGVPDLWVSGVESTSVPYTWTTEQAFINALYLAGTLQIGFVKVCELETRKVDLSGYVQKTQKVNGKALTEDITLTAPDVGARADTWMPTAAQVGARPSTWVPTKSEVGLGSVDNTADLSKPVSTAQQAALNLKAGKSTQVDATIGTSWGGSAGAWTQAISVAGVTATNVVEVFIRKGATAAQDEAYTALQLRDGGQSAGSITLLAKGDKNTIAVPITVIVRGDL